ncbi:ead/Ea22-like family protein, partial [Escherichia coli]
MESNIKGLVAAGHEMASELKAECGAVDMRSVAKLISDLATQLEVQLVRANALAAENAGLNKFIAQSCYVFDGEQDELSDAYICATDGGMPQTPATDAFLADVRAVAFNELRAAFVRHAKV